MLLPFPDNVFDDCFAIIEANAESDFRAAAAGWKRKVVMVSDRPQFHERRRRAATFSELEQGTPVQLIARTREDFEFHTGEVASL